MTRSAVSDLIDDVIAEFRPGDLNAYGDDIGTAESLDFLRLHRPEYVQAVFDVVQEAATRPVGKVLEIGAFFGVVSLSLSRLGCQVVAADSPEYVNIDVQRKRFAAAGVETVGVRLEDYLLPFSAERFDVVIMCQVIEHLNFNPLPLLKEINRVGRPGSLFYVASPNPLRVENRLRVLRGRPAVVSPIQSFFDQLDPADSLVANGHWREYSKSELIELLEPLGYRIDRHYFYRLLEPDRDLSWRNRLSNVMYETFPSLMDHQTVLATRRTRTDIVFDIPDTVNRALDTL